MNGAEMRGGLGGQHGFIDNDADVLAVAHLDIAPGIQKYQHVFYVTVNNVVHSVALDDRLGAYLICEFLPSLGLKYDILLTENEEVGASTATDFDPKGKKYNWMFQFDRRGNDVVLYEYDSKALEQKLVKCGFRVGTGSFSDICYLEDLEIKGMNFGVGYFNEHSLSCHANLKITAQQVDRFLSFYWAYYEQKMYHEPLAYVYSSYLPANRYYYSGSKKYKKYSSNWRDDYHQYYGAGKKGKAPTNIHGKPLTGYDHYDDDSLDKGWEEDWYDKNWKRAVYNQDTERFERPSRQKKDDNNYGHAVEYWDMEAQEWIEDRETDWAILYPKFQEASRKFMRDYAIDIEDLSWEDYCGIVGIDPVETNTWTEESWIICQAFDAMF